VGTPLAIEEALHAREERDELVVVAFVEVVAVAGVFVDDLGPRRALAHVAQQLPRGIAAASGALLRQQPQRPQQHLAQVANTGLALELRLGRQISQRRVVRHGGQCRTR
jgi:hypothetical protein